MGLERQKFIDQRTTERTSILHRTRASTPQGMSVALTLVDISSRGFMARCEEEIPRDTLLHVNLPVLGKRTAEVRWSLGGRIGCEFCNPINVADKSLMLTALMILAK